MPKKGKSSIGRSLKRRKTPDAHLPSSEQPNMSSQHADDISQNPGNSPVPEEPACRGTIMPRKSLRSDTVNNDEP